VIGQLAAPLEAWKLSPDRCPTVGRSSPPCADAAACLTGDGGSCPARVRGAFGHAVSKKWIIVISVGGILIGLGAMISGIDRIMVGRAIGWIAAGFGLVGILVCLVGLGVLLRSRGSGGPPQSIS
jgi:hypothetical protein